MVEYGNGVSHGAGQVPGGGHVAGGGSVDVGANVSHFFDNAVSTVSTMPFAEQVVLLIVVIFVGFLLLRKVL